MALMLWHGGFRDPAQIAFAVVAVLGLALFGGAWSRSPLLIGLTLVAAANLASLATHRERSSIAPTLAALALPLLVALALPAGRRLLTELPLTVALLGATVATAGLGGLALHVHPLAERIADVWRAQGTLEYPPALGLLCVCALAATLALHAAGTLDRTATAMVAAILAAAAIATFDRVAWIETVAVLVLFAARVPQLRRTAGLAVGAAAAIGLVALAIAHPSRAALERHLRHGPISSRSDVWHASWDAFRDRPLLGYGPGQFRSIYDTQTNRGTVAGRIGLAHDAVLEQAVEAGAVAAAGTAIALLAMLAAGASALRSRDPARLAAGVAAVAVALSGLYDITWSFAPLLLLGAVSAVACRERSASDSSISGRSTGVR
jgi:O-antigen ligase